MKYLGKFLLLGALFAGSLSTALAGSGSQYWETLRNGKQFEALKPGDTVAIVCNQCKTVSEITVKDSAQAMVLCQDGASVTCPACKMQTKVRVHANGNSAPALQEVSYVNDKGEECMFIAKVAAK